MKRYFLLLSLLLISCNYSTSFTNHKNISIGTPIDSLNGVKVFYNGSVNHVAGRNSMDGYNLGLKYQCVEFVKRYYYLRLNHKMPDSYGHAKDFFQKNVPDASLNKQRNLIQYSNPSISKPQVEDLIVMDATNFNPYGHVAIVSQVLDDKIEIIQQNPGTHAPSRVFYKIEKTPENHWRIKDNRVLGWLRKK